MCRFSPENPATPSYSVTYPIASPSVSDSHVGRLQHNMISDDDNLCLHLRIRVRTVPLYAMPHFTLFFVSLNEVLPLFHAKYVLKHAVLVVLIIYYYLFLMSQRALIFSQVGDSTCKQVSSMSSEPTSLKT